MSKFHLYCFAISFSLFSGPVLSNEDANLFKILKQRDQAVFDVGFGHCRTEELQNLMTEDLEFYHDIGGVTLGLADFTKSINEGLCRSKYKPRRKLVDGTLEVFPLYQNGELYGAIQRGIHEFYEKAEGQDYKKVGIAKFTHLWVLKDKKWKIKRVLSFDHRSAQD